MYFPFWFTTYVAVSKPMRVWGWVVLVNFFLYRAAGGGYLGKSSCWGSMKLLGFLGSVVLVEFLGRKKDGNHYYHFNPQINVLLSSGGRQLCSEVTLYEFQAQLFPWKERRKGLYRASKILPWYFAFFPCFIAVLICWICLAGCCRLVNCFGQMLARLLVWTS